MNTSRNRLKQRKWIVAEPLERRRLLTDAVRLSDIMPGAEDSLALSNGQYVAAGGNFYFAAVDSHGLQPYVSNGTAAGTKPLVPAGLNSGNSAEPQDFTSGGGFVYFSAVIANTDSPYRRQVFRTDESTGATIQVSSLPDSGSASDLAFVNGHLVYWDTNNLTVYRVDGTKSVQIGSDMNIDLPYGVVGNNLFFDNAGTAGNPAGLYVTDGSTITSLAAVSPYLLPTGLGFNGDLFFESTGSDNAGDELWVSNGTVGGTSRVNDFAADSVGYGPHYFVVSGGFLYFTALDTSGRTQQIYRTDGLSTTQVTSLTILDNGISGLTDLNGTLYFVLSPRGVRPNLYKLVNDQPVLVGTTSGGSDGGTNPSDLTAVGNTLYFTGLDTNGKVRLFETDGITITLATGDAGTDPSALTNVNGSLFYQASDTTHGAELHIVPSDLIPPPPPLSLTITGNLKINEGDTATLHADLTGGTIKKIVWDFEGTGAYVKGHSTETHTYADVPKGGDFNVRVKVLTTDGTIVRGSAAVAVANVDPGKIKLKSAVSLPGVGSLPLKFAAVPYLPITFTATFKDPGKAETYTADWSFSDGTTVSQPLGTARIATITHRFKTTGIQTASVAITDANGGHDGDSTHFLISEVSSTAVSLGTEVLIGQLSGQHKVLIKQLKPGIDIIIDGVATPLAKKVSSILVFEGQLEDLVIDPALQKLTDIIKAKK